MIDLTELLLKRTLESMASELDEFDKHVKRFTLEHKKTEVVEGKMPVLYFEGGEPRVYIKMRIAPTGELVEIGNEPDIYGRGLFVKSLELLWFRYCQEAYVRKRAEEQEQINALRDLQA